LPFRVHNLKVETFSSDDFIPTAMKFWQDELEELEGAELENQLLEPIPYHQVQLLDNM
jgi:hypothetical protein